ncbi:hypothetical protein PRIPAC_75043 [Pristionchus pacificus]|uniref:Uncharacterized protein n=1 Tax=Pristionchus pacificus TaxID=54126 RepID=A0A2A6C8L7_PRIPA|nr:hypothetical protein PRIPAC_75043 [Pristionchus pacificus]|eukprot:PDM74457.1 hypothetical protein PRIPAC_41813 [Pristionchus pacificus]
MIGKTLFKQFQIYLNGILVEDSSPLYAWRSIIETELNFDKETKNSTLSLAGYASDEKINDPTSSGYKRRSGWIEKDGEAQFAASLNLNLFNQPRLLLNYVDFKLVAYLNEPKFVIDSLEIDKDLKKPDDTIYTYEILDMKLLLHEYELYDSASMAIEQLLKQEKMITYPLTNIEMRSFYVAPGRFDTPECRLLTSALPKRIVMCMVDAQSYLGSHCKSPFNFRHFDVKDAFIECGGRTIPSRPLNLDFEKDRYMPAYLNMLEGTGMGRSVGNNGITREMYKNGSAFFVFEISPSLDSETFDLIKLGTTSFNIKFNKAVPESGLYCILHCEYDSVLTIDDNRVPHVDALM